MKTKEIIKKSGFVAIIGRSNVGKSTLLNALIGTKIAIVTPKPQTTRSAIQGILSEDRGQVIFIDTPGLYHETNDALTKNLNKTVSDSLVGVDLVIYLADPTRAIGNEEHAVLRLLTNIPKEKKILVLNKSDYRKRPYEHEYLRLADSFQEVIQISAKQGTGLKNLIRAVFELLPPGEAYFPIGQFTTLDHRQWIAELIREKIFARMHDEVPYSIMVEVRDLREDDPGLVIIGAAIITTQVRYRKMLIGRAGQMIKSIGTAVRKELEGALQRKVYLGLEVEVEENWKKTRAG